MWPHSQILREPGNEAKGGVASLSESLGTRLREVWPHSQRAWERG